MQLSCQALRVNESKITLKEDFPFYRLGLIFMVLAITPVNYDTILITNVRSEDVAASREHNIRCKLANSCIFTHQTMCLSLCIFGQNCFFFICVSHHL